MPGQRACDRCYRHKQKCTYEDHAVTCIECDRSASTCTTSRTRLRQGRPAKVKPLGPEGSVRIWDLEGNRDGAAASEPILQSYHQPSGSPQQQSTITTPKTRNADTQVISNGKLMAYHSYKLHNSLQCHSPILSFSDYQRIRTISPFDHDSLPGVVDRFYKEFEVFMLGPSFAPSFRAAIKHSYTCSPILLHDIILGVGGILITHHTDIAKGTVSLHRLRTARVFGVEDAFAIVGFGQTLAAFDLLTTCVASTFILRYSLSTIEPWYTELSNQPSLDPIIVTSILWDTVHCLIRREKPVLRFTPRDTCIVDRMAGLCTSLLPIFYDLCVVSTAFKSRFQSDNHPNTDVLARIQQGLLSWTPETPANFSTIFSSQEVLRMEAQAAMYQKAGLLILHRIQNPIGKHDDIAMSHATSIMSNFFAYSALLKPSRLQNVTFPILMAAFEIADIPKSVWENIVLLAAAPVCAAKMMALVEYVWLERHRGTTKHLFDIIDAGPDFVVIP